MTRLGVAAACAVVLLTASACGGEPQDPTVAAPTTDAPSVPPSPTPSATAVPASCAPVTHPEMQSGSHLIGDAEPPVPYSSTPGTSGWHAGGAPRTGVFGLDDALTEPELVHALEVGQIVVAYDPDTLPDAAIDRLEELASTELEGSLTVTPFTGDMGAPLVINGWATRQPCDGVDRDTIVAFVEEHRDEAPAADTD